MASAKATIDHDEIRRWVEERGGHPAHVKRTGDDDDPGVLRIDYPGYSGQGTLERMSWDEWFEWFDRDKLAFLYQAEGNSRFSKLVARDSVEVSSGGSRSRRSSSKKASEPSVGARLTHAVKDVVAAVEQVVSRRGTSAKKKSSARKRGSSRKASSRKSTSRKTTSRKSASRKSAAKRSPSKKRASSKKRGAKRSSSSKKRSSKKR